MLSQKSGVSTNWSNNYTLFYFKHMELGNTELNTKTPKSILSHVTVMFGWILQQDLRGNSPLAVNATYAFSV